MDTQGGPGKPFRLGAAITRKAIKLPKAGNDKALRLCLEQLIPLCRERPVRLTLPPDITTAAGISSALATIPTAVAQGDVTTGEAVQLANVLEVRRKIIETEDFDRRLTEIENRPKTRRLPHRLPNCRATCEIRRSETLSLRELVSSNVVACIAETARKGNTNDEGEHTEHFASTNDRKDQSTVESRT
jgi:hypothetical protein